MRRWSGAAEFFVEEAARKARLAREWRLWARRIAGAARRVVGRGAETYVFGSVISGGWIAASDVDVMVVLPILPAEARERARVRLRIEEEARLPQPHPFEIHLVTREEARRLLARSPHVQVEA